MRSEFNSMDSCMHHSQDTYSLTDFKQNAKQHLHRLHSTGRAEVLTVNGRAEAVVLAPAAYDRLLQMALGDVRAKIAVGLRQVREGKIIDGETALKARRARRVGGGRKHR